MSAKADAAEPKVDFEAALQELESLIKQMESGELGLEESITAFERGVRLTRRCQAALKQAELRVQALNADNDFEDLDPETLNEGKRPGDSS